MKPLTLEEQRGVAVDLVVQVLLADGTLATREVEVLDRLGIPQLLGVPRDALIQAIVTHCRVALERPERGGDALRLIDLERFEQSVDRVADPDLRELVVRAMLVLAKADGIISPPEQTLLRTVLTRWEIPLARLRD